MNEDFESIYKEHYNMIYRFVLRMCAQESLAEEVTQETFYQAMRSFDKFQGNSSLTTWLCGIARRVYLTNVRKQPTLPLSEAEQKPDGIDVVEALIDSDRKMTLHRLLHTLDEPYREVFMLRIYSGLQHEEIGSLFGKTGSWARVTYYRARQMLQKALKEAETDEE